MKRLLVSSVAALAIASALAQGVAPLITASQLASGAAAGNLGLAASWTTPLQTALGANVATGLGVALNSTGGFLGWNYMSAGVQAAIANTLDAASGLVSYSGLATDVKAVLSISTSVATAIQNATNAASGLVGINSSGYVPYLQHVGPATNATDATGNIGETLTTGYVSGVSMSSGSPATVTSLALTAGNWELWSSCVLVSAGSTVITYSACVISATTNVATPIAQDVHLLAAGTPAGIGLAAPVGRTRISIAAGTTYYLVINPVFTTSTLTAGGIISATRVY